jgi:hypothetical protein
MTRTLFGIHGKAGSGKDTLCQILQALHPFSRMAFADPLKAACGPLFNLPTELLLQDDFKQYHHQFWGMTIREIYQKLGTEAMRSTFGDDFWIRRWELEYLAFDGDVIVTDVRFENEAAHIRMMGGLVIHVERPSRQALDAKAETHASEAGIEKMPGDYVIQNNGTLEDLKKAAACLMKAWPDSREMAALA